MSPALHDAIRRLEYALNLFDGSVTQGPSEFYLNPLLTVVCYARRTAEVAAKEPA